ncbi:MAG: DMT family transporter [Geitlerinemataceae cyanobacterium]
MTKTNSPENSVDGDNPVVSSQKTTDVPTATSQSGSIAPSAKALLLLIVGLLALSSTAIFIKLSIREISAEATVFNRLWIATIVFAGWNWGWQRWQSPAQADSQTITPASQETTTTDGTRQDRWTVVGLLVALALVHLTGRFLWTWSLTQTTAANGATLANMPPLFTALGGWLFLGQRFDRRFLTGLGIAVGGAIVLTLGDWLHPEAQLFGTKAIIGDSAALLSSVFYAGSFLLVEKLRQRLTTPDILVWRCAIGLAIAAPLVFVFDDSIFPISPTGWLAVFGLAVISEVMGHGLIVYSLKHFSSAFVTIVLLLEPAPTAIVAWILLGEFLGPLNILGFILISVGIYLAKTGEGSDTGDKNQPPAHFQEELVEAAIEP